MDYDDVFGDRWALDDPWADEARLFALPRAREEGAADLWLVGQGWDPRDSSHVVFVIQESRETAIAYAQTGTVMDPDSGRIPLRVRLIAETQELAEIHAEDMVEKMVEHRNRSYVRAIAARAARERIGRQRRLPGRTFRSRAPRRRSRTTRSGARGDPSEPPELERRVLVGGAA
jgi:hypothetical protein